MKMIFRLALVIGTLSSSLLAVSGEPPAPSQYNSYDNDPYQQEESPYSHGHAHGLTHSHSPHVHSYGGHSAGHSHSQQTHGAYDPPPPGSKDHEVVVQEYHHGLSETPAKVIQHGSPLSGPGSSVSVLESNYRQPSSSLYKQRRPVYHAPSHSSLSHSHSHSLSHGHSSHSPSLSHSHSQRLHSSKSLPSSYSSYEQSSPLVKVEDHDSQLHSSYPSSYREKVKEYPVYSAPSHSSASGHGNEESLDAYSPSHGGEYGSTSSSYHSSPAAGSASSYSPPGSSDSSSYGAPVPSHSPYSSYSANEQSDYDRVPVYRPKAKQYRSPLSSYTPHTQASLAPYTSYGVPPKTASYGSAPSLQTSYGSGKSLSDLSSYGAPKTVSTSYSTHGPSKLRPIYGPPKTAPTYNKNLHTSYYSPKSYYRSPSKPSTLASPAYSAPAQKGFGYSYTPTDKGYVRFAEDAGQVGGRDLILHVNSVNRREGEANPASEVDELKAEGSERHESRDYPLDDMHQDQTPAGTYTYTKYSKHTLKEPLSEILNGHGHHGSNPQGSNKSGKPKKTVILVVTKCMMKNGLNPLLEKVSHSS